MNFLKPENENRKFFEVRSDDKAEENIYIRRADIFIIVILIVIFFYLFDLSSIFD